MDTVSHPREKSAQAARRRRRAKEREDGRGKDRSVEQDRKGIRNRLDTPKAPPLKRTRTDDKRKFRDTELELGELPNGPSRAFDIGDDFLPFVVSDDEAKVSKTQESHRREKVPEREWDKGKRREGDDDGSRDQDRGSRGTKRKYEMVFDEDSWDYMQRRQDHHHPSRKAPWVADVNWDGCRNVAEMYAS